MPLVNIFCITVFHFIQFILMKNEKSSFTSFQIFKTNLHLNKLNLRIISHIISITYLTSNNIIQNISKLMQISINCCKNFSQRENCTEIFKIMYFTITQIAVQNKNLDKSERHKNGSHYLVRPRTKYLDFHSKGYRASNSKEICTAKVNFHRYIQPCSLYQFAISLSYDGYKPIKMDLQVASALLQQIYNVLHKMHLKNRMKIY